MNQIERKTIDRVKIALIAEYGEHKGSRIFASIYPRLDSTLNEESKTK
jgi:hypothetical protein